MQSIQEILSQLTIKEKCDLGSGADTWHTKAVDHLNVPSILMHDGPHGLRKQPDPSDELGMNAGYSEDKKIIMNYLKFKLKPNDIVLFKASRGVHLEEIIDEFYKEC